jgi:hypothetical protein
VLDGGVVSFTSKLLYPQGKESRRLIGLRTSLDILKKEKFLLLVPGVKPLFFSFLGHSQVVILTEKSRLLYECVHTFSAVITAIQEN